MVYKPGSNKNAVGGGGLFLKLAHNFEGNSAGRGAAETDPTGGNKLQHWQKHSYQKPICKMYWII